MKIRRFREEDLPDMINVWNEIVREGNAFPQMEELNLETGKEFFDSQTYCGVADNDGKIIGLYILHPNNVGRCGHIANSSYAMSKDFRGLGVGKLLVEDSLKQAKAEDFKVIQFNAVVESNITAQKLYESIGFQKLGTIPDGFYLGDGKYENVIPYIKVL